MSLFALTSDDLAAFWPHLTGLIALAVNAYASCHAVLNKRDTRSVIGWVGVIWLAPFVGPILYYWLGINRIRRKARTLRAQQPLLARQMLTCTCDEPNIDEWTAGHAPHLHRLPGFMHTVTGQPLLRGNKVEPLENAAQAYPAMLEAINHARRSISLATYIFDHDEYGQQFVEALRRAMDRGVQVRVLIDAIGAHYRNPAHSALVAAGIKTALFLPALFNLWLPYSNLRCHRKILVVDGRLGFTGGMNIRGGKLHDLHFRVTGPVVAQMQQTFVDDWVFAADEVLTGELWFPPLEEAGDVLSRAIVDGPDEDHDKFRLTLLGALACAEHRVVIRTPYFLPDLALVTALNVAAMRGVEVRILLPQENNLAMVQWASTAMLWQVLEHGCRVWLAPPPFDHSKLMIVDGAWTLIGSANWDPRSLRLNFEFNLECYHVGLAQQLETETLRIINDSREVSLADVDGRSLPIKLRDGLTRLLTPYL